MSYLWKKVHQRLFPVSTVPEPNDLIVSVVMSGVVRVKLIRQDL